MLVALTACGSGSGGSKTTTTEPEKLQRNTGPAPWLAPINSRKWIVASGLPPLPTERLEYHVHAHLDIFVNGTQAPVAANIGIDNVTRVISPLHTHDTTGFVHIEAAEPADFTLGQFFTEWAVRLTPECVGGYCRPQVPWRVVVNGQDFEGDPNTIVFRARDEIAFVIGTAPPEIPSTFDFSPVER